MLRLLYIILVIPMLAISSVTVAAEPEIRWRKLPDGSFKLQVQGWSKDTPPVLKLYPVKGESANDKETKAVSLPTLKAMSVKGAWQLAKWMPQDLNEGVYRFGLDGKVSQAPVLRPSKSYLSIRGDLQHQAGKIQWSQPSPGAVRVLLQFPSGLTVASGGGWKAYAPGQHEISCDFKGDDGIDYRYQPNLAATVQVASFSSDIFVIGNPKLTEPSLPNEHFDFKMSVIKPKDSTRQGLRVELTPESLKQMGVRRFEILIYADGIFVHEESQGVSPYTYILPSSLSKSTKQLTVNLLDYQGNWGVRTIHLSQK